MGFVEEDEEEEKDEDSHLHSDLPFTMASLPFYFQDTDHSVRKWHWCTGDGVVKREQAAERKRLITHYQFSSSLQTVCAKRADI